MSRPLFQFKGGVHPPGHKAESNTRPIHAAPLPKKLVIPLRQHIGNPAKPVVSVGDHVRKGQIIGEADGYISTAVHASSSGIVTAVDLQPVPHVSGLADLCVTIETDGRDEWVAREPLDLGAPPAELRMRLRDLGIVGLGGAVFPSAVKLDPGAAQVCPTLIINGGECEPWITCDDVLMRHFADEILQGVAVMRLLLGSSEILIGIEDNKPEAIAAMQAAAAKLDFAVEIVAVPARYPAGGAKQMIETLTGKQVPSGKLSTDIGIQVFNVGTARALARAACHGEPLISRLVTVTGHVLRPQNFEVLIGTPMHTLITLAGERDGNTGVLMGGPMMGVPMPNLDVPVVKATNCVLVKSKELFPPLPKALPCIRCTRCADACPAELQPQELFRFAKAGDFGRAQEYHLFDCIECGCCSYVCPSHIPLVDFYRYAKSEIWAREKDKRASDLARERHEFRQFRIEREKKEKAEKLAAKAQAKRAELAAGADTATPAAADADANAKKALIAAALARAQAKKDEVAPKNIDNLSPDTRHEIEEIEARRAKIRELARQPLESEEKNS
ncbi:Electron transport complex, RnfABCDGE type, C subunit [Thiobacillus denitrificans ATCC 25259]|uniref:Ion-translocating oxidoreductase complex subunit C n=1 Tax=Thiobacillus denitrificans (strain ATCC 25259 / T1) TaxID=292415 RepID=Q3SHB6_THIDA|nr:electron transport complex subunit RsxC [Thiobacillus denitrificans]AAZ97970.1 Electron transport complex, RnfABCDGE type, C subunit [Thiobacillus denitrificans ATCC 25259]